MSASPHATPAIAGLLALAMLTVPRVTFGTTINLGNQGTYHTGRFQKGGVSLTPEVNLTLLNLLNFNGLGVVGGTHESTLDAGESVLFTFASPATAVSYGVQFGSDADGDGTFAEASVEGYGADGTLLGVGTVGSLGTKDVSGLFGGAPLSAFRLHTRDNDRQRLSAVSFDLGGGQQNINLGNQGTYHTGRFQKGGVSLTPEVNLTLLNLLNLNGVGVVGGTHESTLDAGESVLFTFASPATAVSYGVQFGSDADGDGTFAEASVEGYGADGTLLGVGTVGSLGTKDVSGLFGGVPLSAFRLRTRDNDRQRLSALSFDRLLDGPELAPAQGVTLRIAGANPVRGRGVLAFDMPRAGDVELALYDVHGRRVIEILRGVHAPGVYQTEFDSHALRSGVYFAVLRVDGSMHRRVKLTVLR